MKSALAPAIVALAVSVGAVAQAALQTTATAQQSIQRQKQESREALGRHIRALDLAMAGDAKGAIVILRDLTSAKIAADEKDRVYLSLGRAQFQAGSFDEALKSYELVRKGSNTWLESLEERATVLTRVGRSEEALALLKTVLTPIFQDRIHSEPYFLAALGHLRVCDFPSVFKTIDQFKDRYRARVSGWEKSADAGAKQNLSEVSETVQKLNLVETEAIQRLYLDDSGKRMSGEPPKIARGQYDFSFPADADTDAKEVWLDEIENYKVTVKGCPKPTVAPQAGQTTAKETLL